MFANPEIADLFWIEKIIKPQKHLLSIKHLLFIIIHLTFNNKDLSFLSIKHLKHTLAVTECGRVFLHISFLCKFYSQAILYVATFANCNVLMIMSGAHAEAVLNKLTKTWIDTTASKTGATLGSQISDLLKETEDTLTHLKKLEADIDVVKIVNDRLVERIVKTERLRSLDGVGLSWEHKNLC